MAGHSVVCLLKADLYAGEHVKLHFTAMDQLGEPVASFVRLVSQDNSDDQVRYNILLSCVLLHFFRNLVCIHTCTRHTHWMLALCQEICWAPWKLYDSDPVTLKPYYGKFSWLSQKKFSMLTLINLMMCRVSQLFIMWTCPVKIGRCSHFFEFWEQGRWSLAMISWSLAIISWSSL